ncbi:MAG TPA: hypothetical protein VGQ62_00840, partial [Chloroflexota bacterium]|nr:hypothetical protein [Chloroflexota bacterium]
MTIQSTALAQADPQVAAVEAVIQQANAEQAQALATANPALMTDTATAAYYRQLVQTNQGLVAQGATAIILNQLTWGAVSVTGTTATANTTEEWTTTYSDGTTARSISPNVYTLVDQSGSWLIETDQQPTTTPATGVQPTPVPVAPVVPVIPVGQN